tara:strand:- start:212 stop:919 length:708 start_codon:yes stop_codon:yes gene_type:complete
LLRLQRLSSYLAVGASGGIVLIPLAHRLGVVPLGVAFGLFAVGVGVGLVSALVIGVSLIRTGIDSSKPFATIALCIVGCVVAVPLMSILPAVGAPAIHDITTDMLDPPRFVEAVQYVTPGRTVYGGDELANQQREAYPDITPIMVAKSPDEAFSLALEVARDMGWENIVSNTGEQRIEATDTTWWFGFVDDIVIRIRSEEIGSRIDVRSLSRVGVGDLGENAARIRRFRDALNAR